MHSEDFELCTQAIARFQAEDQLNAISAASFAHSKDEWRKRYHKELHALANPSRMDTTKAMSTEDLARMLTRGG